MLVTVAINVVDVSEMDKMKPKKRNRKKLSKEDRTRQKHEAVRFYYPQSAFKIPLHKVMFSLA